MAQEKAPEVNSRDLIRYVVSELSQFTASLAGRVETAIATGEVPQPSAHGLKNGTVKSPTSKAEKLAKPKRQPNVYNLFVRKKIEQLKAEGQHDKGDLFVQAAQAWAQLTDDQKVSFKSSLLSPEDGVIDMLLPGNNGDTAAVVAPSTSQPEVHKKKKRKTSEALPVVGQVEEKIGEGEAKSEKKKKKKKKKDKSRDPVQEA